LPRRASDPTSSTSPESGASTSSPDDDSEVIDFVPEEPEDMFSLIPLCKSPSPFNEEALEPFDLSYLEFFLLETPSIHPYSVPFPDFIPSLFRSGATIPHLRESMISLAALLCDTSLKRPLVRALLHHQETLRTVQDSLNVTKIEEPTIYAVMMLAYFNLFSGKFLSARRHLRGLSSLLQAYSMQGGRPSSTMMLIWRCGLRLDYMLCTLYPCKPIFPTPPPQQENLHRTWIRNTVALGNNGEEWALAIFALDNLQSRAAHLSWTAYSLRREGNTSEETIHIACANLLNEFTKWRSQKLFMDEDSLEDFTNLYTGINDVGRFLDHPPMLYRNKFYANLLNEFRCAVVFVTFVASPVIGADTPFEEIRRINAIDACRSIAATGVSKFPIPMLRILQLVGLVFANPIVYPQECAWVVEWLEKVYNRGVMGAKRVKEMLQTVWNSTQPWTYEETERVLQSPEDLEQLDEEEGTYHTV
jgi:Fungal specific transcription factor domain